MWLATKFGFYSIVQTRDEKDKFMVRARAEKDLKNLVENVQELNGKEVLKTDFTDYRYRIIITKNELSALMMFFAANLDYPNFKDKIKATPGQKDKLGSYHEIWHVMYRYQNQ